MAKVPYEIVGDMASWVHVRDQASNGWTPTPSGSLCFQILLRNAKYKNELALLINMIRQLCFTN
ncbi:hypothetical protein DXT98_29360 [Agrobacterium sp. ICMP 7243]|nr:hypothetical protein DXT98_29360 [Agrobacterium sp. ICMP 7243]